MLSLCKLLKFCYWKFFSLFVLHWKYLTAVYQQQWSTLNVRNSELDTLTHRIPLRSLLLSVKVRYGLSALYYTQVLRLSGRCLELCEQEQPGATSQVKRRPEEKVCRRQPGYGVWGRVIYLIQDVIGGPESVARGTTRSAQSLLKYLKEGQEILSRRTASKQNANLDYTAFLSSGLLKQYFPPHGTQASRICTSGNFSLLRW